MDYIWQTGAAKDMETVTTRLLQTVEDDSRVLVPATEKIPPSPPIDQPDDLPDPMPQTASDVIKYKA
jgi:hypothetical protein